MLDFFVGIFNAIGGFLAWIFDPTFLMDMLKLFVALLCGLILGAERTYRGKAAGIRTNALIAMGACLFMIVSEHVAQSARIAGFTTPDPARIAAQVVTGIGFLGAGTILISRGNIKGLTSAASIWVMAAVGLAIGAGLWKLGIATTILLVIMIELLGFVVRRIRVDRFRYVRLSAIVKREENIQPMRKYLRKNDVSYSEESTEVILGETHYQATLYFRGAREADLRDDLHELKGVKTVTLLTQVVE